LSNEADTCRRYVLPKLYEAGWTDDQISEQKYFTDGRIIPVGRKHRRRPGKKTDYLLAYRPDFPIAVVEAKADYKLPGDGLQQSRPARPPRPPDTGLQRVRLQANEQTLHRRDPAVLHAPSNHVLVKRLQSVRDSQDPDPAGDGPDSRMSSGQAVSSDARRLMPEESRFPSSSISCRR